MNGDLIIVSLQYRRRLAVLLQDCRDLVGDRWSFGFSLIGFRPDLIVICDDSQSGDAI